MSVSDRDGARMMLLVDQVIGRVLVLDERRCGLAVRVRSTVGQDLMVKAKGRAPVIVGGRR